MIPQLYDKFQEWADNGTVWVISDTHFGDEDLRQGIPNRPSDEELLKLINSKVIVPTREEQERNPRSRSAKLRIAEKK